ncbi:MAG: putative ABC exporter domain-containing protein [Gemmatimonadaceae bacterium]
MIGALWYLIWTQARNRVMRQAKRLKQPKYAVAFALGLAYFWFLFFSPTRGTGRDPISDDFLLIILPVIFVGAIAYTWLVGSDRSALAFTRPEVAMLFPAPISRRTLVLYRIMHTQIAALLSTLIWILILRKSSSDLPAFARALGVWLVFTTLSLHRLGVALSRAGALERGPRNLFKFTPALAVLLVILATVGHSVRRDWTLLTEADGLRAFATQVLSTLELPPAGIALLPVRLVFEPLVAAGLGDWALAMVPALLILVLHVWWVLATETAFEEAAAEVSEKQAKDLAEVQARMQGVAKAKQKDVGRTIPLAPVGWPGMAILWKNAVWVLRTNQIRSLLLAPGLVLVAAVIFADGGSISAVIGGTAVALASLLLLFGPGTLRNDLRADLQRLPLLRTLPIPANELVAAEVLTGTVALTVPQFILLGVGVWMLRGNALEQVTDAMRVVSIVAALPLLFTLNGINFALHNGLAVLFPGWVRLGEKTAGGFEMMGQSILTSVGTLLALVLLLILPSIIGLSVGAALYTLTQSVTLTIVASGLTASLGLGTEAWLLILGIGRSFEKLEPMQVA